MTEPVTVAATRSAAAKVYDRRHPEWATGALGSAVVTLPLHPPTESAALRDAAAAASWIGSWRDVASKDVEVTWETRRWANLGTQSVPTRVTLSGPESIARFARRLEHWRAVSARAAAVLAALPSTPEVEATLRRRLAAVVGLDEDDAERLLGVLTWLRDHPDSGLFVRQLPIRGVHSKWIESHRSLVSALHAAATGRADLGLAVRPELLRLRLLDGATLAGARDLAVPLADAVQLELRPRRVVVVENLESMLALPELPDAVALHGQGYLARVLGRLPWLSDADVVYWGDLDTDGFNILSIARDKVPHVRSVLMDRATLEAHRDLCVPDPKPRRSFSGPLTAAELDAIDALREAGDVRLEQERIPWGPAVEAVRDALA